MSNLFKYFCLLLFLSCHEVRALFYLTSVPSRFQGWFYVAYENTDEYLNINHGIRDNDIWSVPITNITTPYDDSIEPDTISIITTITKTVQANPGRRPTTEITYFCRVLKWRTENVLEEKEEKIESLSSPCPSVNPDVPPRSRILLRNRQTGSPDLCPPGSNFNNWNTAYKVQMRQFTDGQYVDCMKGKLNYCDGTNELKFDKAGEKGCGSDFDQRYSYTTQCIGNWKREDQLNETYYALKLKKHSFYMNDVIIGCFSASADGKTLSEGVGDSCFGIDGNPLNQTNGQRIFQIGEESKVLPVQLEKAQFPEWMFEAEKWKWNWSENEEEYLAVNKENWPEQPQNLFLNKADYSDPELKQFHLVQTKFNPDSEITSAVLLGRESNCKVLIHCASFQQLDEGAINVTVYDSINPWYIDSYDTLCDNIAQERSYLGEMIATDMTGYQETTTTTTTTTTSTTETANTTIQEEDPILGQVRVIREKIGAVEELLAKLEETISQS